MRFAVMVPERTIGKWLRKLKLTRVQPRPYHPKKDEGAEQAFKKADIELESLTNYTSLIELAIEKNIVSPETEQLLLSWRKDPAAWMAAEKI